MDVALPNGVFCSSGRTRMGTFSLGFDEMSIYFERYDDAAIHGLRLAMDTIRRHEDELPYWQGGIGWGDRGWTGAPSR